MKKFAKIFTAIAVAFAAYSCVTDATEDLVVNLGGDEAATSVTLSLEGSRVQLGEKADGVYPLYWSNGDQIAINGVASNELVNVQENATEASFSFGELQYPLNIVFPAAEGEAVEGCYPVVFPAVQQYVAGNVDPKAVALYGYVASAPAEDEVAAPAALKHLTGVLQLNVKGNVTLTSLSVEARGGNIAGTYNVDCVSGLLTATEDADDTVTMTFGEGLTLNADEATPIYVTVPAGVHGAIWVTLRTAEDKMTVKFNSIGKPVKAGIVREFKEFTYTPNTVEDESDVYEIDGVDKLIEFAGMAANFTKFNKVVVTADIAWPAEQTWTPIEGFGAFEFDGGGKTIAGLTAPLFGETNAYIHDLNLTDVVLNITDNGNSGAFARRLIKGALVNCSASGASTINCAAYDSPETINSYSVYAHGGLVGFVDGVTLDNCTNDVAITVTQVYKGSGGNTDRKTAIGGIAGAHVNLCSFTNLTNNGDITYTGTTQKSTMYISGIVGRDVETKDIGDKNVAALSNCTNKGKIANTKSSKSTKSIYISGITGYLLTTDDVVVSNLKNEGALSHYGTTSVGCFIGGLVGNIGKAHFKNCVNTADIQQQNHSKADYTRIAGLVLSVSDNGSLDNCDNSGVLRVYAVTCPENEYVVAGGVAGFINDNVIVRNCDNSGQLEIHSSAVQVVDADGKVTTAGIVPAANQYRIGGVVGTNNSGSLIENCTNSGYINCRTIPTGACLGGIVGLNKKTLVIRNCVNTNGIYIKGVSGGGSGKDVFMGGICGNSLHNIEITNCQNTAATKNKEIRYGANDVDKTQTNIFLGGIIASGSTSHVTNVSYCTNSGIIYFHGNKANSTNARVGLGGIVGYGAAGTHIDNCVNTEGALIGGQGSSYSRMGFGGIMGITHRGNITVTNCENYGTIAQQKTALTVNGNAARYNAGVGLGGIIGISAQVYEVSNCENYGLITIANTNADITFKENGTEESGVHLYAGGVIGWAMQEQNNSGSYAAKTMKNLTNYADLTFTGAAGRYYAGGVIGCITTNQTADNKRYWAEISGLKNVANLTFDVANTCTYSALGGVVGWAEAINLASTVASNEIYLQSCEHYGNIEILNAEGKLDYTNVGAILGCARSEAGIVKNSKIGGMIVTGKVVTPEHEDENSGLTVPETIEYSGYTLGADNWYTYLYKGGVEQSVAEADGCGYYQEGDVVPTKPAN